MSKIKEIQAEIDEYKALLNESSVPADEKEMAREEIKELEAKLASLIADKGVSSLKKIKDADKAKPERGDVFWDTKKDVEAMVTKVYKPKKGSALEGKPFVFDVTYIGGGGAIGMYDLDRFKPLKGDDLKPIKLIDPITVGEKMHDFGKAIHDINKMDSLKDLRKFEQSIFSKDAEWSSVEARKLQEAVTERIKSIHSDTEAEPDCEELLARLRANKKKAKIRAKQPKPTAGESIEKAADVAVKKIEAKEGKLSVADKKRIIASFKEIIEAVKTDKEFIKELIRVLTKMV